MDDINPPRPPINKKQPLKPPAKARKDKPYPMPRVLDDEVVRKMPITAKQLGRIKTMYGIK